MKLRLSALATLILLLAACAPEPPATEQAATPTAAAPETGLESAQLPIATATVTGAELAARLDGDDGPVVLDVRTEAEFAEGHIPGALNIPHTELAARLLELPGDRSAEIIVHCRSGKRAKTAEAILVGAGYQRVYDLEGHMLGWTEAGLPVTVEESGS
jgi:rhodanese-related sulfurtransferase